MQPSRRQTVSQPGPAPPDIRSPPTSAPGPCVRRYRPPGRRPAWRAEPERGSARGRSPRRRSRRSW
jgi:hypothetical protein